MSLAGLNAAHNFSFYALPAAWVTCIAPHFWAISLFNKHKAAGKAEWDNCNPKKDQAKEAQLPPAVAERFNRAEAAQNNGFITLPYFAAAVVAGNVARVEPKFLNAASGIYLLSRIAFNYIYINNESKLAGNARSVAYLTGIFSCFALFIKAGNRFFSGYASY